LTLEWLLERVIVCPSGCYLWAGADSGQTGRGSNYAKRRRGGKGYYVHRDVYEAFVGPVPEGHQVDHTCVRHDQGLFRQQRRRCVRPEHLEAVPHVENQRRKQRS
jgi:hypothetical protein